MMQINPPIPTNPPYVGRFAPTPSGFLHLGNLFCSLLAWLIAKKSGGKIILRIEDLDPQRSKRAHADKLAHDLEWLGLTWDEGAYLENGEDYFQSQRFDIYQDYFHKLLEQDLIYPCFCSRAELHAAEAPHLSDGRILYAGTCAHLSATERAERAQNKAPAYRVRVNNAPISFTDMHYGAQTYNLASESGDFIVRRSDGVYAYQLAVTIDDALMGVTQVVRGCDLLSSTPMQLYLYQLLKLPAPSFFHIPLLTAEDGRRLAKRDGDLELEVLRAHYGAPEYIIGLLAHLAGQTERLEALSAEEVLSIFDAQKIPQNNIIVPKDLLKLKKI